MSSVFVEFYRGDRQLPAGLWRQHWEPISTDAVEIGASNEEVTIPADCAFMRVTAEAPCFIAIADSSPDLGNDARIYIAAGRPELIDRNAGAKVYIRDIVGGDV